jgi:hypothetical protein
MVFPSFDGNISLNISDGPNDILVVLGNLGHKAFVYSAYSACYVKRLKQR